MAVHEDGAVHDPDSRWGRERLSGPNWPNWVMKSMWGELPAEVLERVVTFLPLASLLRFKAVSREWNRLISDREFVSRHAQAAAPEEYVLTVRFAVCERDQDPGWAVLDVATRRFFLLSSDFLTEYVKREGIKYKRRAVLAADGGLLCVAYSLDGKSSVVLVCNPILKTVKRLPDLEGWGWGIQILVMRTDRVSMEYEVYFMDDARIVLIYESKAGRWRTVPNIPRWRCYTPNTDMKASKFRKNEFYEPFQIFHGSESNRGAGINSYNRTTGMLSDLGVAFPDYLGEAANLQLVVSNARLFCVARTLITPLEDILEIFEIVMEREGRKSVRLATMPKDLWSLVFVTKGRYHFQNPFVAMGCANSILICLVTGWSVAYDLTKKAWDLYPRNKLWKVREELQPHDYQIRGSNYCLSLCPP